MKINDAAANRKIKLAVEAIAKGRVYFSEENFIAEFNLGCDHVGGLLENASNIFQSGSYPTAIFLSITAIEEIAKLYIAALRHYGKTKPTKNRREDHLFNHKAKHSIALQEVIAIGTRLPQAIGEEKVRELLNKAETGELVEMREAALYTDVIDGSFIVPSNRFGRSDARDLLLLALEVWDDQLVGLTNHTYTIDKRMIEIFDHVKNS